jgi:hypothetical protein
MAHGRHRMHGVVAAAATFADERANNSSRFGETTTVYLDNNPLRIRRNGLWCNRVARHVACMLIGAPIIHAMTGFQEGLR